MLNDVAIGALLTCALVYSIGFIKDLFNKFRKPKQTCFVYCPKCRNELTSSNSFVEDVDGIVKYKCDKCANISFWDFAHYPVPILRTCANSCRYFYEDKFGHPNCDYGYICSPDTMVMFEPHREEGNNEDLS